jgi:hypothetical protein
MFFQVAVLGQAHSSGQAFTSCRNFQSSTGQAFNNLSSSESSLRALPVKHSPIAGTLRVLTRSMTHPQWHLSFFFWGWEHVFSEVLTWLITYFHHSYRHSPMEIDCPCSKKKQGPISMSIRLPCVLLGVTVMITGGA